MEKNLLLNDMILDARDRLRTRIARTPLLSSHAIDRITGARIQFKCDNFQKGGSVKFRGAANQVFSLSDTEASKGVITLTKGNYARALALAARMRGIPSYLIMPDNAPFQKIPTGGSLEAKVTLTKPSQTVLDTATLSLLAKTGGTYLDEEDDWSMIAGEATCALELYEDDIRPDMIIAPAGGGSLLAGTAFLTKLLSPGTTVVGAEPETTGTAALALNQRLYFRTNDAPTLADELVRDMGKLSWPLIRDHVDHIISCSEQSVIVAMRLIWERLKIVVEPSAAVPLAAILEGNIDVEDKDVVILLSGGNADMESLPWQSRYSVA